MTPEEYAQPNTLYCDRCGHTERGKPMNWTDLDGKERTRLVVQHIMGCFVLEATSTGWNTPELARGLNAPAGFRWPIAFWNTDGECWMKRDIATDPTVFDPLHDMNHAWQIVEKMKTYQRPLTSDATKDDLTKADYFLVELWKAVDMRGMEAIFAYTTELICKAALIAVNALDRQGNVIE